MLWGGLLGIVERKNEGGKKTNSEGDVVTANNKLEFLLSNNIGLRPCVVVFSVDERRGGK